jgi:hypothetical protein
MMSNEEIFGIVAALLFFSLCFVCCADWCAECSSDIDLINNHMARDINEIEDIESNTTEKKVPAKKLTLMHPDQLNPIL